MAMFANRKDAGRRLAEKLLQHRGKNVVVLALPRGGVVLGHEIAQKLNLPLDIVVVRKVGHPANPEYAICAVDTAGSLLCNETEVKSMDQNWLKEEILRERIEAKRRINLYRGKRKPESIQGKIAIIVDDGIATGFTARLAVRSVKMQNPEKIIVAVPVAPADSIQALKQEGVYEVVTLEPPEKFAGAVGSHYMQFEQVEDSEVTDLLKN